MQTFLDVSRRRIREARKLLDVPKKYCDGAATCALLAAECALKATLLYGRQATRLDEIPEVVRKQAFASKAGHDLAQLWGLQDPSVQQMKTDAQFEALSALKRMDRYDHRYGLKRPKKVHAQEAVESAEALVDWMKGIVV